MISTKKMRNICKMLKWMLDIWYATFLQVDDFANTAKHQHKVHNWTSRLIFQSRPTATSPARRLSLVSAVWDDSCLTSWSVTVPSSLLHFHHQHPLLSIHLFHDSYKSWGELNINTNLKHRLLCGHFRLCCWFMMKTPRIPCCFHPFLCFDWETSQLLWCQQNFHTVSLTVRTSELNINN